MKCRGCGQVDGDIILDLGTMPPSNAYISSENLNKPQPQIPLEVWVCHNCWLVQTVDYLKASDLFTPEYAYLSGYSTTWMTHLARFAKEVTNDFSLNAASTVLELGTNDGSLLVKFNEVGIHRTIGVEPTALAAGLARSAGLNIIQDFFSEKLACQLKASGVEPDLIVANNVLAHVPNINDFVAGVSLLVEQGGVATFEFPYLLNMISRGYFDTVYHEHFSYLSLHSISHILERHNLLITKVETLPTHGESVRLYVQHNAIPNNRVEDCVLSMMKSEFDFGLLSRSFYKGFQSKADGIVDNFMNFLNKELKAGKVFAAYGAAAKGNTFLNYAKINNNHIEYVVDKNKSKQGLCLPGSSLPIVEESYLSKTKPDYVIILPWNISEEIMRQINYVREWGGKFVIGVPELRIH